MPFLNTSTIWRLFGYNINNSKTELKNLEKLPEKIYWDTQIKKRNFIFQHHFKNTQWYKNFAGNDINIEWGNIPIITKNDLQDFTSIGLPNPTINNKYYFANTSGSSGHPFFFWKNKDCHSLAWAKIIISYENLGISNWDKEARFFGHIKNSYKTRLIEYIKDIFLNRYRFNVFNLSNDNLMEILNAFGKKEFGYIYGYSNVIIEFSNFIIREKFAPLINICPSLKLCIITAEMCNNEDRKLIKKAFGIPVYQEYGSSETSIIAIENKKNNWEISTDRLWVEVVDEENNTVSNGKPGRIIITDLYNQAFPFIRYEIGDIGIIEKVRNFPFLMLSELLGRNSDIIQLPSGKRAPGLTFYYISRSILEKSNSIKQFKIVQEELSKFRFIYVSNNDLSEEEKSEIIRSSYEYLEPGLFFEFERCKQINNEYSGKIQHFFSKISWKNDVPGL